MIDTKLSVLFHRSSVLFLWQPTIIGSHCQLVLSHWLPSVLQTEDRWKSTNNFVSIISVYVCFVTVGAAVRSTKAFKEHLHKDGMPTRKFYRWFSFLSFLPRGKVTDVWENKLQWSDKYEDVRLRNGARLGFIFPHSYRLAVVSFNYGLNVAVPNVVLPPLPPPL